MERIVCLAAAAALGVARCWLLLWRQKSVPLNSIAALAQLLLLSLARVCLPLVLKLCGGRDRAARCFIQNQNEVKTEQTTSRHRKIVVNDRLRLIRGPVKTHYD